MSEGIVVLKKTLDDRHTVTLVRYEPWHGVLSIKDGRKTIFSIPVGLFDFDQLGSDFKPKAKAK